MMDIINEIFDLRQKLRETDHVVLEVLEFQLMGDLAPHDIYATYKQRQSWRKRIEELSQQFYNENIEVNPIIYPIEEGVQ